jgi:hypothetical protein
MIASVATLLKGLVANQIQKVETFTTIAIFFQPSQNGKRNRSRWITSMSQTSNSTAPAVERAILPTQKFQRVTIATNIFYNENLIQNSLNLLLN